MRQQHEQLTFPGRLPWSRSYSPTGRDMTIHRGGKSIVHGDRRGSAGCWFIPVGQRNEQSRCCGREEGLLFRADGRTVVADLPYEPFSGGMAFPTVIVPV